MDIAMKANKDSEFKDLHPVVQYYKAFSSAIEENKEKIQDVSEGQKAKFQVKAAMTLGTNLTGDPIKTYNETAYHVAVLSESTWPI